MMRSYLWEAHANGGDEDDGAALAERLRARTPGVAVLSHGRGRACRGTSFLSTSNDGLVWTAENESAVLWDTQTSKPVRTLRLGAPYVFAAFDGVGGILVAIPPHRSELHLFDLEAGTLSTKIITRDYPAEPNETLGVANVALSADGSRAMTTSLLSFGVSTVRVYDVASKELLFTTNISGPNDDEETAPDYNPMAISSNGAFVVFVSSGTLIVLAHVDSNEAFSSPAALSHARNVTALAFAPDDTVFVSASVDCTIRVWEVESGATMRVLANGHPTSVLSLGMSLDKRWLVSGGNDCTMRVWDLATNDPPAHVFEVRRPVTGVGMSPDGRRVFAMCSDFAFVPRSGHCFAHAERVTVALLGRSASSSSPTAWPWFAWPFTAAPPPPSLVKRFILNKDGDHAIWSRVFGFLVWSSDAA